MDANHFTELLEKLVSGKEPAETIGMALAPAVLIDAAAYLGITQACLSKLMGCSSSHVHGLVERGDQLDVHVSNRLWRLAAVVVLANKVFQDREAAKHWLGATNRAFPAGTPLDNVETEAEAAAVRQVLNAIATGGAV